MKSILDYKVGGEITTDKIKWGCIDEIDELTLWVSDEDGEVYEVWPEQINSYFAP
jgi:hypothetical protein